MNKFYINFVILMILLSCSENPEFRKENYYSQATLSKSRIKFLEETINQTINQSLSRSLTDSTENKFTGAFWAMELLQYRSELTDSIIKSVWPRLKETSLDFQRAYLEIICTLYPEEFIHEISDFALYTDDPKQFAMCAHYLRNSGNEIGKLVQAFKDRNVLAENHPIIIMLDRDINSYDLSFESIADLINHDFGKDKVIVYSFQRKNRDFPGVTIIRKQNGNFLYDEKGELFYIPHLARAITNLPGYITNGNTPQGIFSIQSIDSSKNIFIGPTPNLQMVLPYEVSPSTFFHNDINDTVWSTDLYNRLIPDNLREYFPIYEAYYAGMAGRNEIIAHGTTIDPGFYNDKSYFPFTPSLGCMTAKEVWSGETGKIIESDQIKFINAFKKSGSSKGFLILIEIDNKQEPIRLNEIITLLKTAGN